MERVVPEELLAEPVAADSKRRGLTDALGTTDVAIVHYRIAPGEALPAGLHAHDDQEELFVVLAGEATFETLLPVGDDRKPDEVTVTADEAVRFAPGEFQSGRNAGDAPLELLGIGAPRDTDRFRAPLDCPDCGHDSLRIEAASSGVELVCADCRVAHVSAGCPGCGTEMRATLDGADVVVACPNCGRVEPEPPLE